MQLRAPGESVVTLTSVSKKFSERWVLDSVSVRLEPEKTHVLVGSSGCGKSTLLRILAGITSPDRGEVWIDGQRLTPKTQPSLALKLGYVIQEGGLFPHLSAARNVTLKASLLGWSSSRIKQRLDELIELVGLDDTTIERFPHELSGGQRQRVGVMRALMLDPPLFLLDEPLGALDPIARRALQIELHTLFARLQKTVVLVTHDLNEAAFFGDSITLLEKGKIVQRGSLRDLSHFPANPFVAEFINAQKPITRESASA